MALQTTASGGLSAEMKTFYDRRLLVRTVPMLMYQKFGQRRGIPRHNGKIVEFRRIAGLAPATTPLTEAVPPSLKDLTVTAITATVAQYGDAVGFSDLVSTTTIDPILEETVDILAEQAAETLDEVSRDVLVTGTTVQYANGKAGRTSLAAGDVMTVLEIRKAVLTLTLNRARKIDGFWHAIIHPRTAHDIQGTTEWKEANQYAGSQRIFDGSLGTLYGVKFWVTDKATQLVNASNGAGGTGPVDVFLSLFLGADAYGVVSLAGHNLRSIFKPLGSAGTADPIDQQQSFGWKVAQVTKILNDAFMVRVEHSTSTAVNV